MRVRFQKAHHRRTVFQEDVYKRRVERGPDQIAEIAKNILLGINHARTRCMVRKGDPRSAGGRRGGSSHLRARLANDDAQAKHVRHRRCCHSRGTGTQNQDIAIRGAQLQGLLENSHWLWREPFAQP